MLPDRYESGTLQLPGIAGLLQGIRFASVNQAAIHQYECELIDDLRAQLSSIDGVTVYGRAEDAHVGVLSFNLSGMDSSELADALDARGLCLRGGLHCAPCMHRYLGTQGTVQRGAVFHAGRNGYSGCRGAGYPGQNVKCCPKSRTAERWYLQFYNNFITI